MEFPCIFADSVLGFDDVTLQKPGDKSPRADKWVEDVDIFIGQAAVEFFFQDVIDTIENEIDDFDRGIDDSQFFHGLRQCRLEKLVIQFDDDFLFPFGVIDAFTAFLDRLVETFQLFLILGHAIVVEKGQNPLHRLGNGIIIDKRVIFKECFKNGLCNHMLSQHFDGFFFFDIGVDIRMQALHKTVESLAML